MKADNVSYELTQEQKQELDALEKRYVNGELKAYSWEEVKQELIKNSNSTKRENRVKL